jgi:hypothetical protein
MATKLPTAAAMPNAVKNERIGRRLKFKIAILPKCIQALLFNPHTRFWRASRIMKLIRIQVPPMAGLNPRIVESLNPIFM